MAFQPEISASAGRFLDPSTLDDAEPLRDSVERLARGARAVTVDVGVVNEAGTFMAHAGCEARAAGAGAEDIHPLACLAKPFTATLLAMAVSEGRIKMRSPIDGALGEVTIAQCLAHAHGFDAAAIDEVPRLVNGRINLAALSRALLSHPRLAPPGELYSYGNGGAWLVGAVLEGIYDCRFAELLTSLMALCWEQGDEPAATAPGIDVVAAASACPATGGAVRVSGRTLCGFLRVHLGLGRIQVDHDPSEETFAGLRAEVVRVEGWSAERSASAGWKYYADGWFGHDMQIGDRSGVLRFKPEQRAGFFVMARGPHAFMVQSRLFGANAPNIPPLYVRRDVTRDERLDEIAAASGRFENAAMSFESWIADEGLRLRMLSRAGSFDGRLLPVANGLFLVESAQALPKIVQFLRRDGGKYGYLWNTREVFRRCG